MSALQEPGKAWLVAMPDAHIWFSLTEQGIVEVDAPNDATKFADEESALAAKAFLWSIARPGVTELSVEEHEWCAVPNDLLS